MPPPLLACFLNSKVMFRFGEILSTRVLIAGSGAAVGAGLIPFALGNDTGGSVRTPASMCGCAAMITSYHRMSVQGPSSCCHSIGQTGPLTSNIQDAALVYAAIADIGKTPLTLPPLAAMSGEGALRGVRVGVYRSWLEDCDASVLAGCDAMLDALKACGATLTCCCKHANGHELHCLLRWMLL